MSRSSLRPCLSLCLAFAFMLGCDSQEPIEPDAGSDANAADTAASDAGPDVPDANPPPDFPRTYPPTVDMPAPEGQRWARTIVHLHSTHSHDACDGEPRPDGEFNEPCVADLRAALCATGTDVAWLTDHPEHQVEVTFEEALLFDAAAGDVLVMGADGPIANRVDCGEHLLILRTGTEDELMPLGLERYVADTQEERSRIHNNRDEEAVAAFRDAGALIWQAHAEERSREEMLSPSIDGFEVYQLHANFDPVGRREFLGLEDDTPIVNLSMFLFGSPRAHPDISFLLFLDDNRPALAHWAATLQERPVVGTAGTDAHQNVFPSPGRDGERLDSYRRMISWFSNYVLVPGELTASSAQEALGAGRVVMGFDLLGDISGFDAWLDVEGTRHEVGSSVDSTAGVLHVTIPQATGPNGEEASVTARVLRAEGEMWIQVGEEFSVGTADVAVESPGAYRVEARVTGAHLVGVAGEFADTIREQSYPWIMTNAFRLGLPTPL